MSDEEIKEKEKKNELLDAEYQKLVGDKKMAKIRIPCEQYAYIELDVLETPENIVTLYREMTKLAKPSEGLSDKAFNAVLDGYLKGDGMESDAYAGMNPDQINIIQTIKRSIKRVNNNNKE